MACCSEGFTDDLQVEIAEHIRITFESALFTFPPEVQAHYAARLYRITGDERYVYPILFDILVEAGRMRRDADSMLAAGYARYRTERLLDDFKSSSRKSRYRRKLFEESGFMLFYLDCLHRCARLTDYNIPDGEISEDLQKSVDNLKEIDFASFLLNEDVIRYYGAQAVNYIYDLYYLNISDLRDKYREAFRQVFPDEEDGMLSSLEYKDKIYGLTHFIFADSKYYQQEISRGDHAWILDYFSDHADRILEETKEDIIAEVGLCFLLAGNEDAPEVSRCRQAIIDAYDEDKAMIRSVSGDDYLQKGEHRNVLAIMLLVGWDRLHSGPDFGNSDRYRETMPGD